MASLLNYNDDAMSKIVTNTVRIILNCESKLRISLLERYALNVHLRILQSASRMHYVLESVVFGSGLNFIWDNCSGLNSVSLNTLGYSYLPNGVVQYCLDIKLVLASLRSSDLYIVRTSSDLYIL